MSKHLDLFDVAAGHPVAEKELEEYKKDALRYRFLRKQYWHTSKLAVVCNPKDAVKLGHDLPVCQRLDEMIDKIMGDENAG